MDPLRFLTAECGFFTRQEALGAGCSDKAIARAVRLGHWVRFRRGSYAFADEWSALDAVGRHQVRSNAVLRSLGDAVALSHVSGCVRHGFDVWGLPLDRVHVTRRDGGPGRIEGDVIHHEGFVADDDLVEVEGQPVLRPERCVLEAASRVRNEAALCLMDSALRSQAFDNAALEAQFALMAHWPFAQHLHVPVRMADGRSASVGESRGRWCFWNVGIPAPDLQEEVRDHNGHLIGVTDWWWEKYGMYGEFDGAVKYGRLLKPGEDPGEVVFKEKQREDRLREARDARMLRLVWADYSSPKSILTRFNRLAGRAS
ncbi:MAG TPA: type IV toxin-antitoxin system AbiEi family antitoxin domain-containing protein [Nocardioides sp.]|nr:type IV toxin-antitoxin system AbiEi family antitoxin domain-containing protein [Nocardioides sp.]